MLSAKEIKTITENYTILYVEDEEISRLNMVPLLEIFFKKVYVAVNGQMGLELFEKHPVDIVITDIRMPKMNGLDMAKAIREQSHDIPVIVTTAFSDQEYFIASINLKIDQYLLKPIEEENAKNVFYKVSQMLEDRKKARELERIRFQEKINKTSEQVISQIANAYPNPCIIYMDGTIRFINEAFASLFDPVRLAPFLENNQNLEDMFDHQEGYLSHLDEYDPSDPSKNKVSIIRNKGRKIFRIIRREIEMNVNNSQNVMYTFNDITWEEYQKVKIKNYTEMLEEFIIKNRYSSFRASSPAPKIETAKIAEPTGAKSESVEKPPIEPVQTQAIPDQAAEEKVMAKRRIGDMEHEVLRRSHTSKTTAQDYIQELDDETLKELQELHELDSEFESNLEELKEDGDLAVLETIAGELDVYARKISLLFQFDDLAYAIRSLSSLLMSIEEEKINPKIFNKLYILLSGIQGDLASWRKNIFVEQNALDIHYFDSSLFSACLQIELALSDEVKAVETSEEDFELF